MNEIAEIKEGAWVRTKDGRRVQIWRITAEDGFYCSDLQHHCASELQSTTEAPRAMANPLSERLEELVQGCHGPRSSVIREAAVLARRVEGAMRSDALVAGWLAKASFYEQDACNESDLRAAVLRDCAGELAYPNNAPCALVPVEGGA